MRREGKEAKGRHAAHCGSCCSALLQNAGPANKFKIEYHKARAAEAPPCGAHGKVRSRIPGRGLGGVGPGRGATGCSRKAESCWRATARRGWRAARVTALRGVLSCAKRCRVRCGTRAASRSRAVGRGRKRFTSSCAGTSQSRGCQQSKGSNAALKDALKYPG